MPASMSLTHISNSIIRASQAVGNGSAANGLGAVAAWEAGLAWQAAWGAGLAWQAAWAAVLAWQAA